MAKSICIFSSDSRPEAGSQFSLLICARKPAGSAAERGDLRDPLDTGGGVTGQRQHAFQQFANAVGAVAFDVGADERVERIAHFVASTGPLAGFAHNAGGFGPEPLLNPAVVVTPAKLFDGLAIKSSLCPVALCERSEAGVGRRLVLIQNQSSPSACSAAAPPASSPKSR